MQQWRISFLSATTLHLKQSTRLINTKELKKIQEQRNVNWKHKTIQTTTKKKKKRTEKNQRMIKEALHVERRIYPLGTLGNNKNSYQKSITPPFFNNL